MLNPYPSSATKADLLDLVFEECGRAGYEFDRTPGEDASALRRLDAMMAQWAAEGIGIGYNFPAVFGRGQPSDPAGIPDAAIDTVASWAAFRIAPGMGKSLSIESRKAMADGKAFLRAETSEIPWMLFPRTTARGIGNKPRGVWYPFEDQVWDEGITLADACVGNTTCAAIDGYASAVDFTQGAVLSLQDDQGGLFTLVGTMLTGTGLVSGTSYAPVLRQVFPGATNSPWDTTLAIAAT
jgi:hypothetical protein